MTKTLTPILLLCVMLMSYCFAVYSDPVQARPRVVNILKLEVDGREVHKDFKILLYVGGREIAPARAGNSFIVPTELEGHQNVDVRITWDEYDLTFDSVYISKFDTNWVVGVDKKPFDEENTASEIPPPPGKELVMVYYIDFLPKDGGDGTRAIVEMYRQADASSKSGAISAPSPHMRHVSAKTQRPLSLNGRVVEGEITDDGPDSVKVKLSFTLELTNTGSKPVLILRREPVIVEEKIIAAPSDAEEDKYLFSLKTYPSISKAPEWEQLRKRINKPSPPSDAILELAPNETLTLETDDWFFISKKRNIDPSSKPWDAIRQVSPVWLQVTLEMWAINIEPGVDLNNPELGKILQQRWRRFGKLQIDPLTSEPMLLDLSSLAASTARLRK
jgi:hypothetical protein